MNSSYYNMAAGSFLGTVFVLMSISLLSDGLFHSEAPETPGFAIEVAEAAPAGDAAAEGGLTPIATLLASADPAAGETSFRKCASCHTVDEGGANRVGPNLYGIVNRPIASHEGFAYSAPMTEFSEGGSVVWDYEHLAGFLHGPRAYISGTAMGFAGLTREDELANVIAYLRTLAAEPAPLPEPEAAAEEAPAEEGAEAPAAEGEEAPAADAPAEDGAETPVDAAPTEEAPADAAPADDAAPAEGTAPTEAPMETAPATNEQPAPVPPAGETPAEAAPAEDAPAEAAPAEEVPAEDLPAEEAPAAQ